MKLIHITLTNVGHLEHFDADLPAVALILGANGVGKSTVLDAIMYAAGRRVGLSGQKSINHDPTMLHGDAEKGEILLRFDDPDGNLEYLKCSITPDKTGRYIKAKGAKAYAEAGGNLDKFFNALGYNPFLMRGMSPQERIKNILLLIPPPVTVEEIKKAVGGVVPCDGVTADLAEVNRLHDDIFSHRTDVNRDADTLKKQSELLAKAPGVEDGTDWVMQVDLLRAEKKTLDESEAEEVKRINDTFRDAEVRAERILAAAKQEVLHSITQWRDGEMKVLDGQIKALQDQIRDVEAKKTILKQDADARTRSGYQDAETGKSEFMAQTTAWRDAEFAELRTFNAPKHQRLIEEISAAQVKSEVQLQAEGARLAAIQTADQAKEKKGLADRLTGAIDRLRALKTEISKRMDLPGVTIASPKAGQPVDLCREESGALVPFSRWNTRDKNLMCLRIALKAQADCGLIVIDSIGDFDEESLPQLREACLAYSDRVGFLVGDATKGGLRIEEWKG